MRKGARWACVVGLRAPRMQGSAEVTRGVAAARSAAASGALSPYSTASHRTARDKGIDLAAGMQQGGGKGEGVWQTLPPWATRQSGQLRLGLEASESEG